MSWLLFNNLNYESFHTSIVEASAAIEIVEENATVLAGHVQKFLTADFRWKHVYLSDERGQRSIKGRLYLEQDDIDGVLDERKTLLDLWYSHVYHEYNKMCDEVDDISKGYDIKAKELNKFAENRQRHRLDTLEEIKHCKDALKKVEEKLEPLKMHLGLVTDIVNSLKELIQPRTDKTLKVQAEEGNKKSVKKEISCELAVMDESSGLPLVLKEYTDEIPSKAFLGLLTPSTSPETSPQKKESTQFLEPFGTLSMLRNQDKKMPLAKKLPKITVFHLLRPRYIPQSIKAALQEKPDEYQEQATVTDSPTVEKADPFP
ncbi:hypothetical protein ABW20_dc0103763 [Dactylellina cionopaga]|nr:hypothetical protein ABW20_dc0103763 [Dactylellina cionopaga]